LGRGIEPGQDLGGGQALLEALVEGFADVMGQPGDLAGAGAAELRSIHSFMGLKYHKGTTMQEKS